MNTTSRLTALALGSLAVALWLASAETSVAQNNKPVKVRPIVKKKPDPAKPAPGKVGAEVLKVQGELTNQDGVDPVLNQPAKTYDVKLKKGKTYQIDMVSTDLDSFLRLMNSAGDQLAADDDSGGDLNARILFRCSKEDTYKISAASLNGALGQFVLTVREAAPAKAPIVAKLMLKDGAAQVDGKLTNQDGKDVARPSNFAKVYELPMQAGRTYQIDMGSDEIDSYLRLEDPNGAQVAEDDDGGEGLNARIVYNCTNNGTYRIFATTYVPTVGNFTLTVRQQ